MSAVYDNYDLRLVSDLGFDVPTARLIASAGLTTADLPINEIELDRRMHNPVFPNDKRESLRIALSAAGMLEGRVLMTTLEQAEATRADLDARLFEAKRELAELDEKRRAVSFEAHTGDDVAKRALDRANKERIGLLNSIEELEAALAEAGRRVDAAEREQEMAAQSERAERALEIADRIATRGAKLDAALRTVAEEASAFEADIHELNALGCTHPHHAQLMSHGERAVKTCLMQTPWRREFEHLAPRERMNFTDIAASYSQQISRWAEPHVIKAAAE